MLKAGERVGSYEIVSALGAGGMGEVYRARDPKLNRDVALKILPDSFALDVDRSARFRREAQVLAALNHSNIGAIYDLEDSGPITALVLELVEGPTLADRIAQGPLPVDEAMAIARQIAEALEAAHEQGIIHRDLKPANIKLRPDGTVKVLDFGLAKALAPESVIASSNTASISPTLTTPAMTRMGVILGTAAYMAPEQAKGKAIDKRADVWAFGCVLYEMLAGCRAFEGGEPADAMAAVLKLEPAWSRIPAGTPSGLTRLVRRCLAKDRQKRLQAIGDARLELEEIGTAPAGAHEPTPAAVRRERVWMVAAALAGLAAIALGAASLGRPSPLSPEPIHAGVPLPVGLELDGSGPPELALSPDGRTLAFLAREGVGSQRLYVRRLDEDEATAVPESETAEGPFFSPDGRWLAFAVGTSVSGIHPPELRKYSLETKLTQTIAPVDDYFGGYWNEEGSIVFVGSQPRGLATVPSGGGMPVALVGQVRIDGKDQAAVLAWPAPLPGGRAVLITDWGRSSVGTLAVLDLATRELTSLELEGAGARFVPGGSIVYGSRSASLMAVPFDPATRRTAGTPVALMPDIAFGRNNLPVFAFSNSGTFLYAKGFLRGSRREPMRMIRVARSGSTTVLPFEPQLLRRGLALSPAGDAIVAGTWDDSRWLFDLERRTRTRLPAGGTAEPAVIRWSADGRRLVFAGPVAGNGSVWGGFAQNADGSGEVVALGKHVEGEIHIAGWLPDDTHVVAYIPTLAATGTLFKRIGPGASEEALFTETGTVGSARLSPDGRWVAYDSTASGSFDVYLAPLSPSLRRITVSHVAGSRNPVWSRDGRELYFLRARNVLAVSIAAAGDSLQIGPERKLFEWNVDTNRDFEVGVDGSFYATDPVPDAPKQTLIHLRTHWFQEVDRLVGRR